MLIIFNKMLKELIT